MKNIEIKSGNTTLTFRVKVEDDLDHAEPWKNSEGHGVVSEWTGRDKKPGEWVLKESRGDKRYYDMAATIKLAKRDGWGLNPEAKAVLAKRLGREPTKGEIVEAAVKDDFEYLRGWCNDEWRYVGVIVTLLDDDGDKTEIDNSLWGVEDYDVEHLEEVAQELAEEIARGHDTEWAIVPKMTMVKLVDGQMPDLPQAIQDLHDAIQLLQEQSEHRGRECSKFEDRMGELQVENGKLKDRVAELQAQKIKAENQLEVVRGLLGGRGSAS